MRVAMYYNNKNIVEEEIPKPDIADGEILVKVMASGICGSDVMEWYRIKKAPLVLGHEIAGTVEDAVQAEGIKKGDRVVATHHVPCGKCRYCKKGRETVCDTLRTTKFFPGGFSEYVRVPKINVETGTLKLPENVSFEEGTFVEPLGCAVRGQRLAEIREDLSVLVLGSGISGLLHIQLAKAREAKKVFATDVNEFRIRAAKNFGADRVWNADEDVKGELLKENENRLADLVIVSTGAMPAIDQAFDLVERGGNILLFAPPGPGAEVKLPVNDFWFKCATLTTSYAAVKEDLEEALRLIAEKKVNVKDMITHRLPLKDTGEGFKLVEEAEESIKVIIEPQKKA